MMRYCFLLLSCLLLAGNLLFGADQYQDRWYYASFGVRNDDDMNKFIDLLQTAKEKDFNGVLWACGVDNYARWNSDMKRRLNTIKKEADKRNIEIIPIIWSIGYGTFVNVNPNLMEGRKIEKFPLVVRNGKTVAAGTDDPVQCSNSGMEEYKGNRLMGWFHDQPGEVSFIDKNVKYSGETSIRFENFTSNKYGHGRLSHELKLRPNREYRISIRYKTEKLQGGNFMLQIYALKGKDMSQMASFSPKLPDDGTSDWKEGNIQFNSGDGNVRFYTGLWGGEKGKIWFDDLVITEMGMINPLRRPGTPFIVTNEAGDHIYLEEKDYRFPKGYFPNVYRFDEKGISLEILPGSMIKEGEHLYVDYYVPITTNGKQVSTCMSEAQVYDEFRNSAKLIMEALAPKKWFLSMDEIRAAGSCAACQARNIPLSDILADCITKQVAIIHDVQPKANIYIWSDMLDPEHNSHANYYSCIGDYTGVWNKIPKDLIISCWYYKIRDKSMKFFSDLGFRTQGAAYYDANDLKESADWIETCNQTPNCTGIMYTTWQNKYKLLPAFGVLVKEKSKPMLPNK